MMFSILVTGGAGYIGSHTCLSLIKKGYKIIVFDSLINSTYKSLERVSQIVSKEDINWKKNFKFYKGDLKNIKNLEEIFIESEKENSPIKGVIHFGGLKSVEESVKFPLKYWENNVIGSINLIKIMDKYKCYKLVFSSSATVYGIKNSKLLKEQFKPDPQNPYGTTKFVIEKFLDDIVHNCLSDTWRIGILRYFNPIGSHDSGLIGEDPFGVPNNIFPYITQVAIGKLKELKVYGSDWPTKDGTGIRDYIHVMDLAEAHIEALENLSKSEDSIFTVNIGTGKGTSVLELINTFQKVNNIKIPYQFTDRREGDVPRLVADNLMAQSILKWKPKRNLEDMCRDGWKWQCLNPKGYQN